MVADAKAIGENVLTSADTRCQRSSPSALTMIGTPISITQARFPNQLAAPTTCRKSVKIIAAWKRADAPACPANEGANARPNAARLAINHAKRTLGIAME